jgi:tetratricopeptide (TPR) repeat protein
MQNPLQVKNFHGVSAGNVQEYSVKSYRRKSQISFFMAQHFREMGNEDLAIEYGQRTLVMAVALDHVGLQAAANLSLGRTYYAKGDYHRAIESLRKNVLSLSHDHIRERSGTASFPSVLSRVYLALYLAESGEFAEGIARGEEAVRIAEAVDHPYSLTHAYCGAGGVYLAKGDLDAAIPKLERSLKLHQLWDLPLQFPWIASQLGYAYALAGRVADALPLLEQAVERGSSIRRSSLPRWIAWLSETYLLAERLEDAHHVAGRALELSQTHKEGGNEAWALRLLGETAAQHDPPDAEGAERHYRDALTLANELGIRPLQGHCHLGLGTLYAKLGRSELARAELSTAIERYRAMEMTFWLARAAAALVQLR